MKEHILIVDDEEIVRTGLAEGLEREGFLVSTAASGKEAIQMVDADSIELVLCDLVMEGMDGMAVLKVLQENHSDIPVIILTGYSTTESAISALRLGARDYIQKPAGPDEVLHRVELVLGTVRLKKHLKEEQSRAEQKKKDLYNRLMRAERMVSLGALAEGMAYELNNILAPVVSYPSLILEQIPENNPARQYINEIAAAGNAAARAIHDLQTIGRSGLYAKDPINLNDMVNQFIASPETDRLRRQYPDVSLEVKVAEKMSDMAGSRGQIERIISNLVSNALEATRDGGKILVETLVEHVEHPVGLFESGEEGDYVVLVVEDTGCGMERRELERIFEPFYTRKRGKHRQVSGLGLALVYRVVKDHGGYISVTSQENKGSRFMIYFPILGAIPVPQKKELVNCQGTETILVIDDYEEQRKVASAILESLGYNVLTAESGHSAVKMFETIGLVEGMHPVDLIVLDMILADDFDGLETYKRIIETNPGQRAIVVSGFAETDRIVQVRKLGAGAYVQKPYSLETLGQAVREELDRDI